MLKQLILSLSLVTTLNSVYLSAMDMKRLELLRNFPNDCRYIRCQQNSDKEPLDCSCFYGGTVQIARSSNMLILPRDLHATWGGLSQHTMNGCSLFVIEDNKPITTRCTLKGEKMSCDVFLGAVFLGASAPK
jgi:hypothetical protein